VSLTLFLADGHALVRNGFKPCSEKFFRWHRLSSLCRPPGGRGRPPHEPFHALRVGLRPMRNCLGKLLKI